MDKVDPVTRSYMMSRIRGKNSNPEMVVRRYLHSRGFRYALHKKDLPGKPDLVLSRYNLAIFVHGCFWHRHEKCLYSTEPATRVEFWRSKFQGNVERDKRNIQELVRLGWRVLIVWECGLKHSRDRIFELDAIVRDRSGLTEWPKQPVYGPKH